MMTLKEYSYEKRRTEDRLKEIDENIKDMFDGDNFNKKIYDNFTNLEKRRYSMLLTLRNIAFGQLDTFKILEGDESKTYFEKVEERMEGYE